jgi:hypothetical protein
MKIKLERQEVDYYADEILREVEPVHAEVWDTEPRGMIRAVLDRWRMPTSAKAWEMYTDEGNQMVHEVVRKKMNAILLVAAELARVSDTDADPLSFS